MSSIETLLNETRKIIIKHKKVFDGIEEYFDLLEEYDQLIVLYKKENPLKEPVAEDELRDMILTFINKYFDFESKYEYSRFSPGKKDYALLVLICSYIAIVTGAILTIITGNFIVFALIFVTSFLALKESKFDERFFFIPRNKNSYPFEYTHYSVIAGILTAVCFFYLFSQNFIGTSWVFLITMTLEIGLLLPYQKEIEKMKLRQKYSNPKK